ncbi:hypothetical protein RQP46_009185 [Phenoliferia psychrophenolica]
MNSAPPAYNQPQATPPAGNRIPASTSEQFPAAALVGPTDFRDLGGEPVWVGSALNGKSVQPCKVAPHLHPCARVPYGGQELGHEGRFDVLPITDAMEWVHASNGEIPKGRRPVEGGFEEGGEHLYHALVYVREHELVVPGKTGLHLRAAHAAWGGGELVVKEYQILCWRN